jgi:CRISPR type I-E-associated protein CasB/Cse2
VNFYSGPDGADWAFQRLLDWYRYLDERDRGGRAQLGRCESADGAVFIPAFHGLIERFDSTPGALGAAEVRGLARVALCAGRVRRAPNHPEVGAAHTLAAALAKGDGGAPMSELRFRRLLEGADQDDALKQLRRAIDLLGGNVSLRDVAAAAFDFNPGLRKRWAFDYFRNLPKKQETK